MSRAIALSVLVAFTLLPFSALADKGKGKDKDERGAAVANPFLNIPVSGISPDGNSFAGTMNIGGFVPDEFGGVKAIGILSGTITDLRGATHLVENQVVTVPVASGTAGNAAAGTITAQQLKCNVLNLVLAPLDLNLLGLTVHLDQVVLDITAVAGAGNLLGNLLCAVANLLNGGLGGLALSTLLNNLLTTVGTLLAGL